MRKIYALGAAALFGLAACDQGPLAPPQMQITGGGTSAVPTPEEVNLCKVGPGGSSFDFTIASTNATAIAPPNGVGAATTLAAGSCIRVAFGGGFPYDVTVTELAAAGFVLDSIVVDQLHPDGSLTVQKYVGTDNATAFAGGRDNIGPGRPSGAVMTFYNSAVPTGEWCSPGYWRQPQHLGNWPAGYNTTDLYSAHFGSPPPRTNQGVKSNAPTNPTLLQVLQNPQWYGGDAFNNVGDLLSAAHPDVDFDGERVEDSCPLGRAVVS